MKTVKPKLAALLQPPIFPKTLHRLRSDIKAVAATSKSQKRDSAFSKSRDTREDRGARQMKTSHNSQTLPHGR
jgi:hypothetical protein